MLRRFMPETATRVKSVAKPALKIDRLSAIKSRLGAV
jgi:hypothetical protein